MLWIALFLPELPLQLAQRAQQSVDPAILACVIADGPPLRPLVCCANTAARERGVKVGMPVAAARALVGELAVLPRDKATELQALYNFAGWAGQFTPSVSVQAAEGLLLEVDSTLSLHGGLSRLLVRIGKGITGLGYQAQPGIAPTPLAAWWLAKARALGLRTRMCRAVELLPQRLAALPLQLLDWPVASLQQLQALGVGTIGQCLQLPRDGFIHRFGHERRLDLDRALGHIPDPRAWFTPPDTFNSKLEFGFELNDAMMLLFPLKRLLQEFEGFLRARGAGVQQWQLLLDHMNHGRTTLVISVATPERSAERFLLLAREKLAQLAIRPATAFGAKSDTKPVGKAAAGSTVNAPILALAIAANTLVEFEEHNRSFLRDARSDAIGWQHLVDRLATRLGSDQVYRLRAIDDHRPEQAWQAADAAHGNSSTNVARPATAPLPLPRPLWLLRTPRILKSEHDLPLCAGHLHFIAGPERIEAGWWDGSVARRDYYVARNGRGETLWIYREHQRSARWFLHGVFS